MSGIHHIALPTREADVPAEVSFWSLLGFAPVDAPASLVNRATWLQAADGTQIHLLYASEATPSGHVAITAPDFPEAISALTSAGFPPEPRTPHWGADRSYITSPSGHLIELMAFPPSAVR